MSGLYADTMRAYGGALGGAIAPPPPLLYC